MKKIIAICGVALLTLAFTPEAEAQNLLGRLANRAKNAAENAVGKKIENAVNNAVDKAFGGKGQQDKSQSQSGQQSTQTQRGSSYGYSGGSYISSETVADSNGEYDPIKEFVDGLADINYRQEENRINGLDADEAVQNLKVDDMTDVLKLLPEFPTADQIINLDQTFNLNLSKFSAAAHTIGASFTMTTANVLANPRYTKGTTSAKTRARMDGGAMQIFAAMQKYGIDPEKATDEEMEAFMKKAVANGDIQISSTGKAQAFDMNYTDLMENEIDKISDKISALEESAQNLAAENAFYTSASPLRVTLDSIYNDAVAKWKTSNAYKQVYDIEKDIDKRAWDYICKHDDYNNNGAAIPYPPFWEQGRKQENAIIREYNMSYLNQWIDKLKSSLEKPIDLLKEVEVLDAELEKTFPDKTDLVYANLKSQLGTSLVHISTNIEMLMGLAYSAPVINSGAESKVASM